MQNRHQRAPIVAAEKNGGVTLVQVARNNLLIHDEIHTCDPATGRALTGSWLWESSIHLAEWLASDDRHGELDDLLDKIVLELGAGSTGLPGLFAATTLGAHRVFLTDVAPLLPGLKRNVEVNGLVDGRVQVAELVWGSGAEAGLLEREGLKYVDVVLMSDVFYDPEEMKALARTLRELCGPDTRIWAATEVRTGVEDCLRVLADEGFLAVEQPAVTRQLLRSPEESAEFKVIVLKDEKDIIGQIR